MSFDVYSPCPCGSGKKLKFCCHALVAEMDKAQKFFENKQHRNALQTLEGLSKAHPDNPWVMTLQASVHLEADEMVEANEILGNLIAAHPDHLLGIGLFALTSLAVHGLETARPSVYRALQRCPRAYPDLVFSLASSLARLMAVRQRWMACRAHMVLALRSAPEQEREQAFYEMLEFDGDANLPYPFRGVHQLAIYQGDEETAQQAQKGLRLSAIGCWGPAARLYTKLADQHPDDPVLRQNAGLCRAWEGEELLASAALHQAAQLHTDSETAIELETIAQLLDRNNVTGDDVIEASAIRYQVQSLSKLLTLLDDQERFVRLPTPPPSPENEAGENQAVAEFDVLDRSPTEETPGDEISADDLPEIIARVMVYEERGDEPQSAYVSGWSGDVLDEAAGLFAAVAEDQVQRFETDNPMTVSTAVQEVARWGSNRHFPQKTPFVLRRRLLSERWRDIIDNKWPNSPLMGLGGRTPLEVAEDETSRIPLAAAVSVLDTDGVVEKRHLDVPEVYKRLGLAPPARIAVDEQTPLNSLSVMQLLRLPIAELNDPQLKDVYRRAMLIQHPGLMDEVLREAASRPAFLDDLGPEAIKVYQTLMIIARDRGRHEEALEWVRKQTDLMKSADDTFQTGMVCELQELMLRLEDPSDPELKPLIRRLSENYIPKVPDLRERLHQLIDSYGVPTEWLSDGPTEVASGIAGGTPPEQGIWTPDESGGTSGEPEKKLWLPGSE